MLYSWGKRSQLLFGRFPCVSVHDEMSRLSRLFSTTLNQTGTTGALYGLQVLHLKAAVGSRSDDRHDVAIETDSFGPLGR